MKLLMVLPLGTMLVLGIVLGLLTPCDAANEILKRECETKVREAFK